MSRHPETQKVYRPERDTDTRARAHRGSPWAWVILIALVLAASGWWMSHDREPDGPAAAGPAPATPASDPPRAP